MMEDFSGFETLTFSYTIFSAIFLHTARKDSFYSLGINRCLFLCGGDLQTNAMVHSLLHHLLDMYMLSPVPCFIRCFIDPPSRLPLLLLALPIQTSTFPSSNYLLFCCCSG